MASSGWKALYAGAPWFRGAGRFPLLAYSEFVPPPRIGGKPYDGYDPPFFDEKDPYGWPVSEYEERLQLAPGLHHIAEVVVRALHDLGHGRPVYGLSRGKLADNVAWPPELAARAGQLPHERYVTLLPVALSQTQDDKGRVRWTVFGGSEQGPARPFWRSFFLTPRRQVAKGGGESFVRRLLAAAYAEPDDGLTDLRDAGFRILPTGKGGIWEDGPLPDWTKRFVWSKRDNVRSVRYLLTFMPFTELPATIRVAYLNGRLHLLPCPASLLFWGVDGYLKLRRELPLAQQISLLHILHRREAVDGLRIPQSGWMHEPHPTIAAPDDPNMPIRNTYKRTHRWARMHRHEDELAVVAREDKVAHVLFSTAGDDLGLYGKPMAHNAEVWDHEDHLLLDGPRATPAQIRKAAQRVEEGGLFGYRFQFPPMQVGRHEIYWHRPIVAYVPHGASEPIVLGAAPRGYLTAYEPGRRNLDEPIELWPRPLHREPQELALTLFTPPHDPPHQTPLNVRKLLNSARVMAPRKLPRSFARALLSHHEHSLEDWLASLPGRSGDADAALRLVSELEKTLERPTRAKSPPPTARTFEHTANRPFETAYWKTIASLAEGEYRNKCNADCVHDDATRAALAHQHRDLEALGDHILRHYQGTVAAAGMTGKALVGELPFVWRTDFDFSWMGGWLRNQDGKNYERNLIMVIPGRDRRRAVIMADHYDTAYMEDTYTKEYGGSGARLSAAGADDNHSATAALMLAAPIFLRLSKAGRLGCDVWLINLTGEEFPSDCLGARHLCQSLVEGTLQMRLCGGGEKDLSKTRVQGVYVLDMVAHNKDHERDIFQIAPGTGRASLWLAEQAHLANLAWNAGTLAWNKKKSRRGLGRAKRSAHGSHIPDPAAHLALTGEVRLPMDPRSTLYNTDGQIFSDAGVPVVLFMENYDINRTGYHDTHDTMENIDLDYGSAVTSIAIESVARAACEKPPK